MTDELPTLKNTAPLAEAGDKSSRTGLAEPALAYDYFKSMTSLSVAALGGMLTLGGTVFGARLASWQMGAAALALAVSGMLALQAQTDIVQQSQGVKPPLNSSRAALRLVPAFFGVGLGLFLTFLLLSYVAPNLAAKLR